MDGSTAFHVEHREGYKNIQTLNQISLKTIAEHSITILSKWKQKSFFCFHLDRIVMECSAQVFTPI